MSDYFFIVGIERLEHAGRLPGRRFEITPAVVLSDDAEGICKSVEPDFIAQAGLLEWNWLRGCSLVATGRIPVDGDPDAKGLEAIAEHLSVIRLYLHELWMERDHAASTGMGYLRNMGKVHSNQLNVDTYTADGKRGLVPGFTVEELERARERLLNSRIGSFGSQLGALPGISRFTRANYFVQAARAEHDLGLKLAQYVTAIEALFGTSTSELTYRLSERTAFFIGQDAGKRQELFANVKGAYGVRSKVVHGDEISRRTNLELECKRLDGVLRKCLKKIREERLEPFLEEPSKSSNVDEFFLALIFGG